MSYYNYVLVIFTKNDTVEDIELDSRSAGQMLPAGAIPLAIANENTKVIMEIVNTVSPDKIIKFTNDVLQGEYDNSNDHSDTKVDYIPPEWEYLYS